MMLGEYRAGNLRREGLVPAQEGQPSPILNCLLVDPFVLVPV